MNLALLISHEIDAAFWREWEMFRIPGGVQVFVLLIAIVFISDKATLV